MRTDGADGQMIASSHFVGPLGAEWETFDSWSARIWDGSEQPLEAPRVRSDARDFYRALLETLRHGAPPPVDSRDTLHVVRVLEAIIASAASDGNPIEIAEAQ